MPDTLVLWDIDGTLTRSTGAGVHALQHALAETFGIAGTLDDIDYAGRTDRWIARQIFAKYGLPADDAGFARYLDAYVAALPEALHLASSRELPGARAAVEHLHGTPRFAQALLTGNLERGARAKLGHHDLARFFAFGAFADDSEHRDDLGPIALRRAREHLGCTFEPHRILIVGDTPHDIACGKIIGARTIAVATGRHSLDELRAHAPSAAFNDLTDPSFRHLLDSIA